MRLDASIFGLVAWLGASMAVPSDTPYPTLTAPTKVTPQNSIINFTYPSLESHVYVVKPLEVFAMVKWSVSSGQSLNIQIQKATLYVVENDGQERPIAIHSNPTPRQDRISHALPSESPDLGSNLNDAGKPIKGGLFFENPSEPFEKREAFPPLSTELPCMTLT